MKIAGVLFDWDGVLLDSVGVSFKVYNEVFTRIGVRQLTYDEFLALQSPNWYEFYQNVGVPKALWKKADDEWAGLYREENPRLYPDARPCLEALKRSKFRLALVSNGSKARVEGELGKFGLEVFFESVLCGEKKEELKPSPAMLERTLDVLDITLENAVYIGDAPADVQAARNARVTSIAIARSQILAERLRRENPDYLFGGLDEVTALLIKRK
jgi:HAD superfamily hydrolase (TIGR01549 family)